MFLRCLAFLALASASLYAQAPTISSVVNAGSQDARFSPGTIVDVSGQSLGTTAATLARIGSRTLPAISRSATRWTVFIPADLAPGSYTLEIGAASTPITLVDYAAALFVNPNEAGTLNAVGFRLSLTGALIGPGYTLSATTPAKLGDMLVIPVTGLGPVDPDNFNETIETPRASLAGKQLQVVSSYLVTPATDPNDCYICSNYRYEVLVALPRSSATGTQQLNVSIGNSNSQTFNVPINNLPLVTSLVNAASYIGAVPLAPASLATIYGSTFGLNDVWTGFPATDLGGVSVEFNGIKAPLLIAVASLGQINLQIPAELPEGVPATVKVRTPEGVSADFTAQIGSASPGVFYFSSPSDPYNTLRSAAVRFGGKAWVVMPDSLAQEFGMRACDGLLNTDFCGQPARRGDTIEIYVTGLGKAPANGDPGQPSLATGQVAPANGSPLYKTLQPPTVAIGGIPAQVTFSGIAPGFAGLYQINVQIPANVPLSSPVNNYVELVVSMPNGTSDDRTTLAIRQ